MARRNFQNNVATGRLTLPVVILISALFWIATTILFPTPTPDPAGTYPLWLTTNLPIVLPKWSSQIICYLLYGIIGYMLIELNNKYAIIRTRATVQTSLYFMLIAACPFIHQIFSGSLISLGLLISLFFLFKSYQSRTSNSDLFHSFSFISLSSFFLPQVLFLTPVWLIGAIRFHPLTIRNLSTSLVGILFPYWFLFGYAFFVGEPELFYQPFIELATFTPIKYSLYFSWEELATYGYMVILFLAAFVHRLINGHRNNIRTSAFLDFLIIVSFALLILTLLQPELSISLLPVLIMFVSILIGHVFSMTNSKASNLFFIFPLVFLLLLFAFNLWMPF